MRITSGKDEQIRWMNSLTNATEIVSAFIKQGTIDSQIDIKEQLIEFANFFYNIEPKVTELHKMIEQANTIEELESMKNLIKQTDSITMFNLWNEKRIAQGSQQHQN